MSDVKDESPVKPTVIDLDADDVVTERDPERQADLSPSPVSSRRGWILPVAALGLGGIVGGWLYKEVLASYFPSSGLNDATARITTLEQQLRTVADQSAAASAQASDAVTKLGQKIDDAQRIAGEAKAGSTDIGQRIADLETGVAALSDDLSKVKALPVPPSSSGGQVPDLNALEALSQRVADLEKEMASLKAASKPTDQSVQAQALSQALAELRAKIAAGASYKGELERVQRAAPGAAGLDALVAHANEGLPAAQGLGDELAQLSPSLPKPETGEASDSGYLSGFWKAMSGVITIRHIGEAD
jgi:hypothetical protein